MFAFSPLQYWKLVSSYCQKVETGNIYRCNAIDDLLRIIPASLKTHSAQAILSRSNQRPFGKFAESWKEHCVARPEFQWVIAQFRVVEIFLKLTFNGLGRRSSSSCGKKTRNHLVGGTKQTNQFQLSTKQACSGSQSVLICYKSSWANRHSSLALHFVE